MQVNAHLGYNGHCEEAFKFYEKALDGKIEVLSRVSETPMADHFGPDFRNKVVHARIRIAGTIVMGADAPPQHYSKPQGITVCLGTDNSADADRYFKALAEKGTVGMAMAETFFAHRFGMVTDQFGIPWMVIHQK